MKFFSRRPSTLSTIAFLAFVVFFAIPFAFHQIYANDIWKALYSGRYLAVFGQFPHHSTFTFSPVEEIVLRDTYNWLGNLVLLGIYTAGGVSFLQGFRFFVVLFAVFMPLSILKEDRFSPIVLLFAFCYMAGLKQKLLLRTAIFAVPGFVTLFWLLVNYERTKSPGYLWGLPLLFLFWGNMHGSYVLGFGFLLVTWLGCLVDSLVFSNWGATPSFRKLGLVVLVVLLVIVFVKPFPDYKVPSTVSTIGTRITGAISPTESGLSVAPERKTGSSTTGNRTEEMKETTSGESGAFVSTLGRLRGLLVGEQAWRSSEFSSPLTGYSFLFVSMTLVLFPIGLGVFLVSPKSIRFFHLLPVLAAIVLSMLFLRSVGYFSLVTFPIVLQKIRAGHLSSVQLGSVVYYASVIGVGILSFNLGFKMIQGRTGEFFGSPKLILESGTAERFSRRIPAYVLREFPRERFFTQYNISAYLVWKWWPYKKVFFDSKGSAYRDNFFREYGTSTQEKLTRKYNIDFVLNPYNVPYNYAYYIPDKGWNLVAFDSGMILFGRANRVDPVDPLKALLITADEFRSLRPDVKEAVGLLVNLVYRRRNLGRLDISESGNVVLENDSNRTPLKPTDD